MINGGRWNHKNTCAVYASSTRALAMLEILVHIRSVGLMPKDRIIVTIEIPDKDIVKIAPFLLSSSWNTVPDGPASNKDLFESEVRLSGKLGMIVPSEVLPQESNYVISPEAKLFAAVKIRNVEPLVWDYRL
jgi:RES domain-containing protein